MEWTKEKLSKTLKDRLTVKGNHKDRKGQFFLHCQKMQIRKKHIPKMKQTNLKKKKE
jgi:hypothetical protein